MIDAVRRALHKLRDLLTSRAEHAYEARDAAEEGSHAHSYAAGEAHAYGIAADDARNAEGKEGE